MSAQERPHVLSFTCQGRVDLRNALAKIKRDKPRRAFVLWTFNAKKATDNLPVIEIPEGTLLWLTVFSGLPSLHMASGRVGFRARSVWGNSMTVHGGELHVVTDGHDRKVTVNVEPDSTANPKVTTTEEELGEESRLRLYDVRDRNAMPTVVEADANGIPLSWSQESEEK